VTVCLCAPYKFAFTLHYITCLLNVFFLFDILFNRNFLDDVMAQWNPGHALIAVSDNFGKAVASD